MVTCKDCVRYQSGRCAMSDDDNDVCDKFKKKEGGNMKMIGQYSVNSCPHCGSIEAVEFGDLKEEEWCANCYDEYKCPCYAEDTTCNGVYVVCSVNRGGCGATGGFGWNEETAVKNWNRRA